MKKLFNSLDDVEDILLCLSKQLEKANKSADLIVVGGVAMLTFYPDRLGTSDIDTTSPLLDYEKEILAVAKLKDLPGNWLNDGAKIGGSPKGFDQSSLIVLIKTKSLTARTPGAKELLAMKLKAGRIGRDDVDIKKLLLHLKIENEEETVKIFKEFYLEEEDLEESSKAILKEHFENL